MLRELFRTLWYRGILSDLDRMRKSDTEEAELVGLFVEGDPPNGSRGVYSERFTLGEIRERLQSIGRMNLRWELFRCHQVGYWKGYFFKQVGLKCADDTIYTIVRQDVSGCDPG